MSKKDNTPAISFFSFQDIITSVTGIMFLVVMLLVLMVLRSPVNAIRQKEMNVSKEIRASSAVSGRPNFRANFFKSIVV